MTTLMVGLRKLKWIFHSVVNQILLMVFQKDPYLAPSDIADYASDTTPYECDQHCGDLISNLEFTLDKIFCWFDYNSLKEKRYLQCIQKTAFVIQNFTTFITTQKADFI